MHQSILFAILQSKMDYLDPGSGSMIIQMIIAAVLGLGVVIRVFWNNIKAFFTGKKVAEDNDQDPTSVFDDDSTAVRDQGNDAVVNHDHEVTSLPDID